MINLQNYGPYSTLVTTGKILINVSEINKSNWNTHFTSILNIMRDGIETEFMAKTFITIRFDNGDIELSIPDYFFNLIMWYLIVETNSKIQSRHIFFQEGITRRDIKNYIDKHFIKVNRTKIPNIMLNNIIDDCLHKMTYIDEFSGFFANSINLEDIIALMNQFPEFNDIVHADLSGVPIENVKKIGMDYTNKAIEYIMNSDHCLSDFFRAKEGVNDKQFKEFLVNIGAKPDGRGGAYPAIINSNFLIGGVNDLLSLYIESNTGRTAQIIVEGNVGTSGYFARLLGLNSIDTILHLDPDYVCDSVNFENIFIKNRDFLNKYIDRYYRLKPNGMEYLITEDSDELVGQWILLRSPMTCASHSRGEGICYRCYGTLAHTNNDINIGKIAAEEVSSKLTQMMLSAKHLLESAIVKMKWVKGFKELFEVNYNMIQLADEAPKCKILIDPDSITPENEYEKGEYNEYIQHFDVLFPDGTILNIHTEDMAKMYITIDLNEIIRDKAEIYENKVSIDISHLKEIPLFLMQIHNNELSRTLEKIKDIIDKNDTTKKMDRHQLLQTLVETLIEGKLDVMSIHGEIILSNQLRHIDNILEKPEWQYPNEPYDVLTLNQALMNNPSINVTLSYERISKTLYNPLTYRKHKPSFMDLFFMEKPQNYLSGTEIIKADTAKYTVNNTKQAVMFVDKDTDIESIECETAAAE